MGSRKHHAACRREVGSAESICDAPRMPAGDVDALSFAVGLKAPRYGALGDCKQRIPAIARKCTAMQLPATFTAPRLSRDSTPTASVMAAVEPWPSMNTAAAQQRSVRETPRGNDLRRLGYEIEETGFCPGWSLAGMRFSQRLEPAGAHRPASVARRHVAARPSNGFCRFPEVPSGVAAN